MVNTENISIFDYAMSVIDDVMSHELERTSAAGDDLLLKKHLGALEKAFTLSPVLYFTVGLSEVTGEINVMQAETQNYIRNFIASTAIRLHTTLNTHYNAGWDQLVDELHKSIKLLGGEVLPDDYTARVKAKYAEDMTIVTMYLMAQSFQRLISNLGIAKHNASAKRPNRA